MTRKPGDLPATVDPLRGRGVPGERGDIPRVSDMNRAKGLGVVFRHPDSAAPPKGHVQC